MRPTTRQQSALQYPLNTILGTEANVRVLRVLFLSDVPLSVSELARRAALHVNGVARVCTMLEDQNVLEAVGTGARQYRRSPRFPFSNILFQLFTEERTRHHQVLQEIRSAVDGSGVQSGWIEGSVGRGDDRPGDTIVVSVLVEPQDVESVRTGLWRQLLSVQRAKDITIELRVLTLADLKAATPKRKAELETIRLLRGAAPMDIAGLRVDGPRVRGGGGPKTHAAADARSKDIAEAIADRLRKDPSLVERARDYIERRLPSASPGERLELTEWQDLLTSMSVARLRRFLTEDNPRTERLRQSSPFLDALSPEERDRLFKRRR